MSFLIFVLLWKNKYETSIAGAGQIKKNNIKKLFNYLTLLLNLTQHANLEFS
jgi:hypothetical protein